MMCSYSRYINLPWPATGKDKQAYKGRCIVMASYKFMSVKLAMQKANTTIFVSFRLVSVHARIKKVLSEGTNSAIMALLLLFLMRRKRIQIPLVEDHQMAFR